jgi:hypothetical protein
MSTEEDLLRQMAADESVPAHLRLGALKELGRREASAGGERAPDPESDPRAAMEAIVERYCPQPKELESTPADPMRDLDCCCSSSTSSARVRRGP